eukprot:TRINITY_DN2494_c0_g1_i3.p1 TRINITY_DN2494_c0_g1~~TRINITY_DN2494_c0_g1_i3.p1  ORF type:complete len:232 (+),score=71.73 TRINITY_DN2494_c0_g1_i3:128-823(+)
MSDAEEKNENLFKLEKASSGRSKCRITGEKIEAGKLRVGVEGYMGGRVVTNWVKPLAFLQNCAFEYSPNNRARCKKTGNPLNKDEIRFVFSNGLSKSYLSPEVVPELFEAIMKAAKFDPMKFKGIDALGEDDQKIVKELFKNIEIDQDDGDGEDGEGDEDEDKKENGEEEEEEEEKPKKTTPKKQQNSKKNTTDKRKRKSEEESTEADDTDSKPRRSTRRKVSHNKKDSDD